MAALSLFGFLAIAAVFHLVYIYSIMDIYFVSPIVPGMRLIPVQPTDGSKPPADRLVFFVGDGLRADKAFQSFPEPFPQSDEDLEPRPLAPFLRSRVLEHGTFGVSHTRVPTESRPGHVALIAGLYEDVSAVTTGWKLNPVNFDSVFNRSRHTWSWGSPDILPMFEQGAVPGRVDAFTYDADMEDNSQDATRLDGWVFDHVRELFGSAATNQTLDAALREDRVVFFLHLLGLDTTGHSYRPYSKEYLNNIKVVDRGVHEITDVITKFYEDERTAFVFTADHGMSDWGSHGDGHPDNTRTPLIAWGSGVSLPVLTPPGSTAPGHDEYSSDWGLDHVRRNDVAQADVAALMAHLLGVEFPANSVGELPLAYLDATAEGKARASLANARAILEIYNVKEANKGATQIRFRPYPALSGAGVAPGQRVDAIQALIQAESYEQAIEESAALIRLALAGLRYLQTYDWLFLRTLVTVGYLGWIAFALTNVVDLHVVQRNVPPSRDAAGLVASTSALVGMYASFFFSNSPATYYAYALFPVIFWEEVYARRASLKAAQRILFGGFTETTLSGFLLDTVVFLAVVLALALSYLHREVLTLLFLFGALWPATYGAGFVGEFRTSSFVWVLSCLVMSIFTLLPAMKVENIGLVMAGGASMAAVGIFYLLFPQSVLGSTASTHPRNFSGQDIYSRILLGIQIGLVLLAMIVTRSSALSLQAKNGLPRGNQLVGWLVLASSLAMPLVYHGQANRHYMHRLMVHFLTFAPTFTILALSYEGLFYVVFSITLITWVKLEHHARSFCAEKGRENTPSREAAPTPAEAPPTHRPLGLSDARVALFFFVFLQSAFFSTGNIASVSSFSLESVYRLIPIFDPLSQGALLVLKLLIPFTLISASLGVLNRKLGVAPSSLFMVVMAIGDILTLYFFWVVKDEGSWLEIGSTISHFVIASLLCVFVAALEAASVALISGMWVDEDIPENGVALITQSQSPK